MREKIVGILGGMGPEATIDLFQKITNATPAKRDQEHIRVIIDSNPKTPSRQQAILENGPSPLPMLIKTARNLERAGAEFLIIACYLTHYFIDEIRKSVGIPVIDMIVEAVKYLKNKYPGAKTVGLLASTGAVKTKLFHQKLEPFHLSVLVPDEATQQSVMEAMYDIKAGKKGAEIKEKVLSIVEKLRKMGADVILIGCTELPLVLDEGPFTLPIIDPASVTASVAVKIAKGTRN